MDSSSLEVLTLKQLNIVFADFFTAFDFMLRGEDAPFIQGLSELKSSGILDSYTDGGRRYTMAELVTEHNYMTMNTCLLLMSKG